MCPGVPRPTRVAGSLVLIPPTPMPGTPFMVDWGHRQLGVEGGDVATMASASLCQHPGAQAEVSLHPTRQHLQWPYFFLQCTLGHEQTHTHICVESNRKKSFACMAQQTTAITFFKNTSSHLLRVRLSQSHAEYRTRRWELSPQGQKPSPRGSCSSTPSKGQLQSASPEPFQKPMSSCCIWSAKEVAVKEIMESNE